MSENKRYILENSELAVTVIPAEGGRISSLRSLKSGVEFLTQSLRRGPYVQPGLDASFPDGPCAGIEECIPTVGRCGMETQGGTAPDHGDFWQLAWETTQYSDTRLNLHAIGFSRPLLLSKELRLEGSALKVSYRVENLQHQTVSFLYACHPLFAVSQGDRVLLPQDAHSLVLYYSRNDRLGTAGAEVSWPSTQANIPLDIVGSYRTGIAEMLYTDRLGVGVCGIYRNNERQGIKVLFDVAQLPYLGVWLCYGGWPDRDIEPLQYAVALEPTVAPCNTLAEAQRTSTATILGSRESFDWDIRFQITDVGISFEDFGALDKKF